MQSVAPVFLKILSPKKPTSITDHSHHERVTSVELSGQSLELFVESLVQKLDRSTPKFLKYLTDSCPSCMDLPDDCPYVDYSIFDVKKAAQLGPQSQKGIFKGHKGDDGYPIKLWFDFRENN